MKYIFLFLIIVCCSCKNKLHNGIVVDKTYEPFQIYTYTTFIQSGKVMVPVVNTIVDNEDYIIEVKGVYRGDTITETFYLNQSDWECIELGNNFNDSIPCSREDKNNTDGK